MNSNVYSLGRRRLLGGAITATAAGLAGPTMLSMSHPASAASTLDALAGLRRSPRMPVLFVGHGSPMNAIEDNAWRRGWQALGQELSGASGARWPQPQLILCVSAHWLTRGWWLTGMERPRTIHDFGGFPQELFDQQYPAPGAPRTAADLARAIAEPKVGLDTREWGLDHGTWSVLKPMFPKADIPVLQLSMDYSRAPQEHLAVGRRLRALREHGVLVVGSGNIVHNLRAVRRDASMMQAYDWAVEFDRVIAGQIERGEHAALATFRDLGAVAQMAHPTWDHYLPLLHAAGAVDAGEPVRFFNVGYQAASISMRSVLWG